MLWNRYFIPSFLVLSGVAFFNWIGTTRLYYWSIFWYDIPMHFFGGVWVALAALWVSEMPFAGCIKARVSRRSIVSVVIAVGVVWEIYEVAFGIMDMHMAGYAFDTVKDLIMDTLGALSVAFITQSSK
jgi:hypothetical protein